MKNVEQPAQLTVITMVVLDKFVIKSALKDASAMMDIF